MRISDWSSDVGSSDLALQTNEHGGLEFGPNARPILRGEEEVSLVLPPRKERRRKSARNGSAENPVGDPLFDALRACRRELAQEAGVPPYVIFHDSTLRDMAEQRPPRLTEPGPISGEAIGRASWRERVVQEG